VSYRLLSPDLAAEVRRVAREQIDAALGGLEHTASNPSEGVHEARRRLKRVRALLRVAREPLGDVYGEENRRLRDVGRALAGLRDAEVARQTFDRVFPDPRPLPIGALREALEARLAHAGEEREPLSERRPRLIQELRKGRRAIECWPLSGVEGFDGLEPGLVRSYRRGRRGLRRSAKRRDPREFHEWRKRVKYHREHIRLLQETWKRPLRGRRRSLSRLSDLLGEAHDLFMLRQGLVDATETPPEEPLSVLDRHRRQLESEALLLGRRLYVEKPRRLVDRLRVCWEAWLEETALREPEHSGE
jgi:CHAD domain-containing protein